MRRIIYKINCVMTMRTSFILWGRPFISTVSVFFACGMLYFQDNAAASKLPPLHDDAMSVQRQILFHSSVKIGGVEAPVTRCDELASYPRDPDALHAPTNEWEMAAPEALAACKNAVDKHPESGRLHFILSMIYSHMGEPGWSFHHFSQSIGLGYRHAIYLDALTELARARFEDDPRSLASVREAIESLTVLANSGHWPSQDRLASVYIAGFYVSRNLQKALEWPKIILSHNESSGHFALYI